MTITIRKMIEADWNDVTRIYQQGIDTKRATFQREIPSYNDWSYSHLSNGRFVACDEEGTVLGWVALSPTSSRFVYRGVAEVSIYIAEETRNCNVGTSLLQYLIEDSEKEGIWTLQSTVFEENEDSLALHIKCGFRQVGIREKIGKDAEGLWHNTILLERRSAVE